MFLSISTLCIIAIALFTVLQENPGLVIGAGALIVSILGLLRLYKKDQQAKDEIIITLQNRVQTVEKEHEHCSMIQSERYAKIDRKFEAVFAKLDDLPDKVAQSVNMIRIEQDIKISDTNKRIDDILKDKRK
jgi:hypothetical protein